MTTKMGVLHSWNGERGFGFIFEKIQQSDGKTGIRSHFVHILQIKSGEPIVGYAAHFNIGPGKKGPMAVEVEFEASELSPSSVLSGGQEAPVKETSNG